MTLRLSKNVNLKTENRNSSSVQDTIKNFETIRRSSSSNASAKNEKKTSGIVKSRVEQFENKKPDFGRSVSEDVLSKSSYNNLDTRNIKKKFQFNHESDKKMKKDSSKPKSNLQKLTSTYEKKVKEMAAPEKSLRTKRRKTLFDFNITKSSDKSKHSSRIPKPSKEYQLKSINPNTISSIRVDVPVNRLSRKVKDRNKEKEESNAKNREESRTSSRTNSTASSDRLPLPEPSKTKKANNEREYLKYINHDDLLEDYHIVERIGNSYVEQINEIHLRKNTNVFASPKENSGKPRTSQSSDENEIKIYRLEASGVDNIDIEFGFSVLSGAEDNYIVEAYNVKNYELIISTLDIKHEQIVEKSIAIETSSKIEDDSSSIFGINGNLSDRNSSAISESSFAESIDFGPHTTGNLQNQFDDTELRSHLECSAEHRETYYDNNANPRIEKVIILKDELDMPNGIQSPLERKDFVVEELVNTEENYIKDLEKVVLEYLPFIDSYDLSAYPTLNGKQKYLFGNIEDILKGSMKFLDDLKQCSYSHEKIAKTFLNHRKLFQLYPIYSKNKPKADDYIQKFKFLTQIKQEQLGDRLDLASYLLTPIQRLGKYILFLQNINKELNKRSIHSKYVQTALDMVKTAMTRGNDYLAIDSIKNCPLTLNAYGSFIMTDNFMMLKPKKYECAVFLFDEVIVFTSLDNQNLETFNYEDSIKMDDLTIVIFEAQPKIMHLKNYTKCKKGNPELYTYVLEAKTTKIKRMWQEQIEKRLWEQVFKYKEQVRETYLNEGNGSVLNKKPNPKILSGSKTLPKNAKLQNTKYSSKFYVPLI